MLGDALELPSRGFDDVPAAGAAKAPPPKALDGPSALEEPPPNKPPDVGAEPAVLLVFAPLAPNKLPPAGLAEGF